MTVDMSPGMSSDGTVLVLNVSFTLIWSVRSGSSPKKVVNAASLGKSSLLFQVSVMMVDLVSFRTCVLVASTIRFFVQV